jgi:hypothetical protein
MEAMRKDAEAIQASARAQLVSVLDDEQLAEYDALQQEWRKERRKNHQRPSGGK